jgi:hypothetical protein
MSAFGGKADMVCDHHGSGIASQNEIVEKKYEAKIFKYSQLNALAGAPGFEPGNGGIKIRPVRS